MEPTLKRCKQCGDIKSELLFREYYGRGESKGTRTGRRYKTCTACESVNNRYKYLNKKVPKTSEHLAEIEKIESLYEIQKSLGFRPPNAVARKQENVIDTVDAMLAKYQGMEPAAQVEVDEVPPKLQKWLDKKFYGTPEEVQESFDEIEMQFKPQVGLNERLEPMYDTKYKRILDDIQDRLDEYEEAYYKE